MATWNSRGLRGSTLEEFINRTNDLYKERGMALVQKIPTPITPVAFDKTTKQITRAYFEKDSTVDYIGAVQGIPICFDAKECNVDKFPLQNIHEHQIQFMEQFELQKGISFFIIYFTHKNICFYVPLRVVQGFIKRVEEGHPKYFKMEELDERYLIKKEGPALLHYLEGINLDLMERK
ncbi:MAG: Holliday junction resolvase RecU [Eubacteriales bacterium]|nr:Holliday junction resolvase RecU [Eubacteriales bacterium]